MRNAARRYNLVEIDLENKAFSQDYYDFGGLVGNVVLTEINHLRRKINEALPLDEIKSGTTLSRRIARNEETWRSIETSADIEIYQLKSLVDKDGLSRARNMILNQWPSASVEKNTRSRL